MHCFQALQKGWRAPALQHTDHVILKVHGSAGFCLQYRPLLPCMRISMSAKLDSVFMNFVVISGPVCVRGQFGV